MASRFTRISSKEYQKRAEQLLKQLKREVQPFTDSDPQSASRRRQQAGDDLLMFCKTYLPHYFEDDWESGHKEIGEKITSQNRIIQILGFRGLGKTTLGIIGYGLQCILFKRTRFLPVISDTEDQAMMLMLPLKIELEENDRIRQDFGAQKGVEWAEDAFVTTGNVKVEAYSWRSFKRGRKHMQWRAKVALCDDLENSESAKNKSQVDKRYDHLIGEILNGLNLKENWQVVVCTNKLARYDLSHLLAENTEVLTIRIPSERENGRATHPKTFPKRILNQLRRVNGLVKYSREYLLTIISSDSDDFQEEWMVDLPGPAHPYKYVVTALDPSVGSTEGHDHKAIVTAGLTIDQSFMDVTHAWLRRTTINSMCRNLFEVNRRMRPHKILIESNGFQTLLKDKLLEMARTEESGFEMISKIKQVISKTNKNTRILRLQGPIENGTMRFIKNAGDMDRLKHQLLEFDSQITNNEDDGPDALEMCQNELWRMDGRGETVEAEII